LYCSTRPCAAPFAFIVIALHSRTSAAFLAADLPQPSRASVRAAVNRLLVQRVPRVHRVHCMGPPGAGWATNAPHSSEASPGCARAPRPAFSPAVAHHRYALMPITRINEFQAKPDKSAALREFLSSVIARIIDAPVCRSCELLVPPDDSTRLAIMVVSDGLVAYQASRS